MIGYITIGARDTAQSNAFYDAVLGTIGYKRFAEFGAFTGFGIDGKSDGQSVWVCKPFDGKEAHAGNGIMVAFNAADRTQAACVLRRGDEARRQRRRPAGPARQLRTELVRGLPARSDRQQAGHRLQQTRVSRGPPRALSLLQRWSICPRR